MGSLYLDGVEVLESPIILGDALPFADDAYDIGSAAKSWQDLFIDGVATIGGNVLVADGSGVVIGNATQITVDAGSIIPELQVLGTGGHDNAVLIGRWSADANPTYLFAVKSRNATIGSSTIVQDDDKILSLRGYVDDGVDFTEVSCAMVFEVDDASPAENAVGGAIVFHTSKTTGSLTEALRIDSNQAVILSAGIATYGGTPVKHIGNLFDTTFTSGGDAAFATGNRFQGTVTGTSGDTEALYGSEFLTQHTTQTATENIGIIGQARFYEPRITDNLTGDITVACTVHIELCPHEGEFNSSLYISQAGEDQPFIAFADSDVAHGGTALVPTNVFSKMEKVEAAAGGLALRGYKDADGVAGVAIQIDAFIAENVDTTKSTAGRSLIELQCQQLSGTGAADIVADGNVFGVRVRTNGTVFIVDEAGDTWMNGGITALGTVFLEEQAAAAADVAGFGQFWVKDNTPNDPFFTDDTGVDREIVTADYAGIYCDANAVVTTITIRYVWQLITVMDTDMPEVISNGAHGSDNITVGATADYEVKIFGSGTAAGGTPTFVWTAFELDATNTSTVQSNTEANPGVFTFTATHNFNTNDKIKFTGLDNITEYNNRIFTVVDTGASTITLKDENGDDMDTTGLGVATGGTATKVNELTPVHAHRKFGNATDIGSFSGGGIVSLTKDNTIELYIQNVSGTNNITQEYLSFYMKRVGV